MDFLQRGLLTGSRKAWNHRKIKKMKSACGMFLSGCGSLSLQKSVYYIHYMNTFFIERITKKPFQNDLTSFLSACTDVKLAISKTVFFFLFIVHMKR